MNSFSLNEDGRFLINGRFLTRPMTGVDRFAQELIRVWSELSGSRNGATILVPDGSDIDGIKQRVTLPIKSVGRYQGHLWEQIDLPGHCRDSFLLSLCNTGPLRVARQLAVLHDANVFRNPQTYGFAFRNWYRLLFAGLMRKASVVATVSRFSADELTRYVRTRSAGIEIIHAGGEHILRTPADDGVLDKLNLRGQRYVLAVGSRTPNKNLQGVMQAAGLMADAGVKVVAAGGSYSRVFSGVRVSDESIVLAGYVSDGELRALYEHAVCFLFPSFYEGFGLPILEAMHCGCPVITSGVASMPEVGGNAAVYCDPANPRDIANQLSKVLGSTSLRQEMTEAGRLRANEFSWGRAAGVLDAILSRV